MTSSPLDGRTSRPGMDIFADFEAFCARAERATLVFVYRGDQVLLIVKQRGLGAGKVTGPGGRLEPGETAHACACRELQEEVGLQALHLVRRGELAFQFTDGYALYVDVFSTDAVTGEPTASEEALPFWCARDAVPYDAMWADDILWFPLMLREVPFSGRFIFDGDTMVAHELLA